MAEQMTEERLAEIEARFKRGELRLSWIEAGELIAEVRRLRAVQEKVEEFAEEMMQSEVHKFMGMDLRDLIGGSDE